MNCQQNTVKSESSTPSDPQNFDPRIKIHVRPDEVIPKSITVYKFKGPYGIEDHTALICRTMYDAFKEAPVSELNAVRLFVQAMVLVFGGAVIADASLANTLIEGGIKLEVAEVDNSSRENIDSTSHGLGHGYDQDMREYTEKLNLRRVYNPNVVMQAYCGVILLLAVKKEPAVSNEIWTELTKNRVLSLVASMGSAINFAKLIPFNKSTVLLINRKLRLHTGLRASMVRVLLGITGSSSIRGSLASSILKSLAWAEMNHIIMIQEFLFERYPELLTMRHLLGSLGVLESALEYLAALDETERPYAKILYNSLQAKALERDRFDHLIAAAHAVRKHIDSSFIYDCKGLQAAIGDAVTKYLQELDLTGTAVGRQVSLGDVTDKRILRIIDKAEKLFSGQVIGLKNLEN